MTDVDPPADDAALEALLRERKFGPPPPDDATPWEFVLRWPDATVRNRAWPIISRLLTDDDERVRARAIELVRVWDRGVELTMPRLLGVAERHPELYGDQAPDRIPLRDELAFALSNGVDERNGARVAAVLKRLAGDQPIGGGAASVLGRYEPAFVAAQAYRWGDAQLRWIVEATRTLAMFRRDEIIMFLHALQGLTRATRTKVLEVVEEYIKRDDAIATTLAKGQGLPPPTQPAPTPDECKAAIGL